MANKNFSQYATNDYQSRNWGMPKRGVPVEIEEATWNDDWHLLFTFKSTPHQDASRFVYLWAQKHGLHIDAIEVADAPHSDYPNDWVDAIVRFK